MRRQKNGALVLVRSGLRMRLDTAIQRRNSRNEVILVWSEPLERRTLLSVSILNGGGSGYYGSSGGGLQPPDDCGAAGPSCYVQATNDALTIYSPKPSGATVVSQNPSTFFSSPSFGNLPLVDSNSSGAFFGDTTVMFDNLMGGTGRFIIGDINVDIPAGLSNWDIAVSTTNNPTTLTKADWKFYAIPTTEGSSGSTKWSDYPGNDGFNADSVVYTFDTSVAGGGNNGTTQIVSLNASDLANGFASPVYHYDIPTAANYRPTTMYNAAPGGPMWFVQNPGNGTQINVAEMTNNLTSSPTLTTTPLTIPSYFGLTVAPKNPDGTSIGDIDSRILKSAQYGNTIVATQKVQVSSNELDAQWYSISVSGGMPSLLQSGRIGYGSNTYVIDPGVDINPAGEIGMTFMESDTVGGAINSTTAGYLSTFVTARKPSDPAGTMETPVLVQNGKGVGDIKGNGRSGDFSGINVDPVNGTFWATNEFGNGGGGATDIANFSPSIPLFAYLSGTTLQIPGLGNSANSLTISLSSGLYSLTDIVDGSPLTLTFAASAVQSINMTLGSGVNSVSLGGGNLSGLVPAYLDLGSGLSNALTFNDSANNSSETYNITQSLTQPLPQELTRGGMGALSYLDADTITLLTSLGQDGVNVDTTVMNTTTYINANGGVNSVIIGSLSAQSVRGAVTVQTTQGGDCDLTVDDSAYSAARNISIASAVTSGFGAIFNLAPGEIDYRYNSINDGLTLKLDSSANIVDVHGTGGVDTTFTGGHIKSFQLVNGAVTLSGVTITGATHGGINNLGSLTANNCNISGNTSSISDGGGIYNLGTMNLYDSFVTGNAADQNGGGIENAGGATMNVVDCLVRGNSANGSGGGVYNQGYISIDNCTLTANSAASGVGVYVASGNAIIENSILYSDNGTELVNQGTTSVSFSDIQGGWSGTGNLAAGSDPSFDSNLQLQSGSPCINTGNNNDVVAGLKDLAGNTRVINGTVDMGAYENLGAINLVYFAGPPSTVTAGGALPTVIVDIERNGSLITLQDGTSVVLTVNGAQVATAIVSGGQAKFNGLVFNTVGTFSLVASDGTDGTTSQPFSVISGAPTLSMSFGGLPVGITLQQVLPEFGVEVLAGGQIDTGDHSLITLYLDNTNTVLGSAQVGASNLGFALFPSVEFPSTGNHFIQARDPADGIAAINSSNIQVSPAVVIPTLYFGAVPSNPVVSNVLSPAITVSQQTSGGTLVSDGSFVTLSVTTSPISGGTLTGGSLTRQLAGGTVSFSGLSPNTNNTTYTITATDGNDVTAVMVFPVYGEHLVFNYPSQTMPTFTQGSNQFLPSFTVSVVNQSGAVLSSDNSNIIVTVLVPNTAGYIPRASSTGGTGTATFSTMYSNGFFLGDLVETYDVVLQATDSTDNATGDSAGFAVIPGAPSTLSVFGGGVTPAGTSVSPGFGFREVDPFLDSVYSDSSSMTASITTGPAGGTISGTLTEPVDVGFNNLIFNKAGFYSLLFTDATTGLSVTDGVTITGGTPTHLAFVQEPTNVSTNSPIEPPIAVAEEDSFNDISTLYTGSITISVASPAGVSLNGTVTVPVINGVANFSNISIAQIGNGYRLAAVDSNDSSLATTSTSFNVSAPAIVYVDKNATSLTPNGTTWGSAYTSLSTALSNVITGDTIDIAQGDYSPGSDPTSTFQLLNGVSIQGGFETGGLGGPNSALYPTVLDGGGVDYHVVTGTGTDASAILEGVTISNGNATGAGDVNSGYGGGLFVNDGAPLIQNVTFTGNTAVYGGAITIENDGAATTELVDCTISGNTAMTTAGALYLAFSSPLMVNDLVEGNSAPDAGAILIVQSAPTITNCTFTLNSSTSDGAIVNQSSSGGTPVVTNSVLWGDSPSEIVNQVGTATVDFSDVEGGYAGTNNLGTDPNLTPDFHLLIGSVGLGAGDIGAPGLTGVSTDLAGQARISDGTVDLGAYEGSEQGVIYVDAAATGANNGLNWANAFTSLQTAMSHAVTGYTVNVAQGDYSPGNASGSTFQLIDGVTVQGGYQHGGSHTLNPTLYVTSLDGAYIGGQNATVVTGSGTDSSAVLEGVTIENGNGGLNTNGGGMIINGGSPTVTHCTFTANTGLSGGALYIANDGSSLTLTDCAFENNTAYAGGAIDIYNSLPSLINCLFAGNTATSTGGAIFGDHFASATITNCTFTLNSAAYGGAIYSQDSTLPTVTNSIFWNDTGTSDGEEIDGNSTGFSYVAIVGNCDIAGSPINLSGTNNISANPSFVNPALINGSGGNFSLQTGSPCIGTGDPSATGLTGITTDLAGNSRFTSGAVDIGAYESAAASSGIYWTGNADGVHWNVAGNWSDNLVPTLTDNVTIGAGFINILVSGGIYAVNTVTASSPIEIASGGTLNLYGVSDLSNSTLTIDSGGKLNLDATPSSANPGPLVVGILNIGSTGILDIGVSQLVVNSNSLSSITAYIASAFNVGAWTGYGITSSDAMGDPDHLMAVAVLQNNSGGDTPLYGNGTAPFGAFFGDTPTLNAILVNDTYYGDANLDGRVDGSDYSLTDNGYLTHLTGWHNGDFNYDGVINGSDYTLIDNAFNRQGGNGDTQAEIAAPTARIANATSAIRAKSANLGMKGTLHEGAAFVPANTFQGSTPITVPEPRNAKIESLLLKKDVLDALSAV